MKHTTEEMIAILNKIQQKYGFFYQCEKYDNVIGCKKTVKMECHKLFDLYIKNKHDILRNQIENNNLWNRCTLSYVCPVVLEYETEDGVGGQYFKFPSSLDCNIFYRKNVYNINTESSFDALYEKYKKKYEDYYIKLEYDIKQAKIQSNKDNIEKMFNPNYVSPADDFFTKLAKM